jgi:hypothetical protein
MKEKIITAVFAITLSACGGGSKESDPKVIEEIPEPIITVETSARTETIGDYIIEFEIVKTCTDGDCVTVENEINSTPIFRLVFQIKRSPETSMRSVLQFSKLTFVLGDDTSIRATDISDITLPEPFVRDDWIAAGNDWLGSWGESLDDGTISWLEKPTENEYPTSGYLFYKGTGTFNTGETNTTGAAVAYCFPVEEGSTETTCYASSIFDEYSPIEISTIGHHQQYDFDIYMSYWMWAGNTHVAGVDLLSSVSINSADFIIEDGQTAAYLCIDDITGEVTQTSNVEFIPEARVICQ